MERHSRIIASARSKLETLAWFAMRPAMYRELGRRIRGRRFVTARSRDLERRQKAESEAWCVATAVPCEEALEALSLGRDCSSVATAFPEVWAKAEATFRARGGAMGGAAYVDVLYHIVKELRPERVVETGVAAGWSSLAILLAQDQVGFGRLTSIDMPYPKRDNEREVGCVVPASLRNRWTLIRKPDRDALPGVLAQGPIGVVHYDSDKSCDGRLYAYPLLWKALSPGGILISDDIDDNLAFRDFARSVDTEPLVVARPSGGFIGLLRRAP